MASPKTMTRSAFGFQFVAQRFDAREFAALFHADAGSGLLSSRTGPVVTA